jgi:xanthine/uracil permease
LSAITLGLSLVGLPWMCGATVQSINHVQSMAETHYNEETDKDEVSSVIETRVTGFLTHLLILSSLKLLHLLKLLPEAVVSGIFLHLGRKLMSGNSFLAMIGVLMAVRTIILPKLFKEQELKALHDGTPVFFPQETENRKNLSIVESIW